MVDLDLRERLTSRSALAGLVVPDPLADHLVAYLALLLRWNKRLNLTGLASVDAAIDRLILEPLAAVEWLPSASGRLVDVGSGGGSPAIPLKMALPQLSLTMIEVKERKAAFLREAIRVLGLTATSVESARFESVASSTAFQGACDLVSVRALRLDAAALRDLFGFLKSGGLLIQFHADGQDGNLAGTWGLNRVAESRTVSLLESTRSSLTLIKKE